MQRASSICARPPFGCSLGVDCPFDILHCECLSSLNSAPHQNGGPFRNALLCDTPPHKVQVRKSSAILGIGKRGLLEKGSFQKSPSSRDSRDSGDPRQTRKVALGRTFLKSGCFVPGKKIRTRFDHDKGQKSAISGRRLHWRLSTRFFVFSPVFMCNLVRRTPQNLEKVAKNPVEKIASNPVTSVAVMVFRPRKEQEKLESEVPPVVLRIS